MNFQETAAAVRNWGRWGADDELGTLNLITPERVLAALATPRTGAVHSLSLGFGSGGVWSDGGTRTDPIHVMDLDGGDAATYDHLMAMRAQGHEVVSPYPPRWDGTPTRWNDDSLFVPLQASTQWDALAHVYAEGSYYNDVPVAAVGSQGASRLGIEHAAMTGLTARGVLVDVPRFRGVPHLEPLEEIEPADLDQVLAAQGTTVAPGDVLLVRTGWLDVLPASGSKAEWRTTCPGVSWRCAEWLRDHEIAAVAVDNLAAERAGAAAEGYALPLHVLCLREMGLMLGELWQLSELAEGCAAHGSWEFLLVAPPLRVTGAVGAPLNPVAIR